MSESLIHNLRWHVAQQVEINWWKKYLSAKDKNHYQQYKKTYWKQLLNQIKCNIFPDKLEHILEVGCGPAGMFILLDQYKVHALDPLIDKYESKLLHFKKSNYPNVEFINTSFEKFLSHKIYKLIICMNVLNHVQDISMCSRKLIQLLDNKGFLLLSIDSHNYLIIKYLFKAIPLDILHPHQYDLNEYKNMFKQSGCKVMETICIRKGFFFNHHVLLICKT